MTKLKLCLYQFVEEKRVFAYLRSTGYHAKSLAAEERWETLRETLTPEQRSLLRDCREMEDAAAAEGQFASFQAALDMGLELGSLPMWAGRHRSG